MKSIKDKLKAQSNWNQDTLEECFRSWVRDRAVALYAGLPSIMVSNIWWARNNVIFKDRFIPPEKTTSLTLNMAEEFKEALKPQKSCCPLPPDIDYSIPWGYFDGASQGVPPRCGVGVVLYINHSHYIHIRYSPGGGTNNKEN
jgi:hypothetical protein